MTLLDLFAGVAGFHLGLEQAGFEFEKVYFSEIDKHAISVYQHHFKDAEYVGSVTDIDATEMDIDIMTWGFPCQDLSLAGKRKGFDGERSSLFHEGIRILREGRPVVSLWENVAGLMSSRDGEDMQIVFDEMYRSGYVFDVNIVNTSWFLPQNRVRLYCVGYRIEDVLWNLKETSGQKKKFNSSKRILEGCLQSRWLQSLTDPLKDYDLRQSELELGFHAKALKRELSGESLRLKYSEIMLALGLNISDILSQDIQSKLLKQSDTSSDSSINEKQSTHQVDIKSDTEEETAKSESSSSIERLLKSISGEGLKELSMSIISTAISSITRSKTFTFAEMQALIDLYTAHSMLYYPNCIDEALSSLIETRRSTSYAKNRRGQNKSANTNGDADTGFSQGNLFGDDLVGSLGNTGGREIFPVGESDSGHEIKGDREGQGIARTLSCRTPDSKRSGDGTVIKVIEATKKGYAEAHEGDSINLSQPTSKTRRGRVGVGVANTLETSCNQGVLSIVGNVYQNGGQAGKIYDKDSISPTVSGHRVNSQGYINTSRIRRLTPIECERLQGFPDNWTKTGTTGEISDTQRYKMMGNAVSVPVVKAVGEQIMKVLGS